MDILVVNLLNFLIKNLSSFEYLNLKSDPPYSYLKIFRGS